MFFCLQAVQNSPSPDTSRTEEASGSSGAVLSSLSIFCFLFLFYQLCVLFILLINLICQIAYLVISFIATVCDSRQFSGNSDVTMKLFKTRRNLVMVKNLIKKNKEASVISNLAIQDIASIQKRKAKEIEDLVEIKLAKEK